MWKHALKNGTLLDSCQNILIAFHQTKQRMNVSNGPQVTISVSKNYLLYKEMALQWENVNVTLLDRWRMAMQAESCFPTM